MPAALQKASVLGGRGTVIEYANRPGKFYYRELVEGERKYRSILIKNAATIEEAKDNAIDWYGRLREQQSGRAEYNNKYGLTTAKKQAAKATDRINSETISSHIEAFLAAQSERVSAGLIKTNTLKEKVQVLRKHLESYLALMGVKKASEISETTFEHYPQYRKEATKLTRKKELVIIKDFIRNHLVKHKLLDPNIGTYKELTPIIPIKKQDLDANPAINGDDWRKINMYIRTTYQREGEKHPRPGVQYWRMLFWTFTIVAKNTGCRPSELLNLQLSDVDIEDTGTFNKATCKREEKLIATLMVRASKTGEQREIPSNAGEALKRWDIYQNGYMSKHKPNVNRTLKDLVFGNPENEMRSFTYPTYTAAWKKVMVALDGKLTGHKFSTRRYTIYSMRSTYIENHLIKGMDIFLLSRLCGHSVTMLMKHYERIDVRRRTREITNIEYGKRKYQKRTVQLTSSSD